MNTIKQVQEHAASLGLTLSPRELEQVAEVQRAERARLEATSVAKQNTFADQWALFYPRLLAFIVSVGETLLTLSQTVIVSLGVPVVLILLLAVEHQRVFHGIVMFEADATMANFAALALVVLNLVLEFTCHYIEHVNAYQAERSRRWSLRLWWANMRYTLGLGETWEAIEHSPAHRYKRLLNLVTFSILALALVGSMRSIISTQTGAWYHAIANILTTSSLLDFVVWIGGLLFALSAVLSAQVLSRYVAVRCVEILALRPQTLSDDPHAQAVEEAGARAALAVINAKLEKKQEKQAKAKPQVQPEAVEVAPIKNPFGSIAQDADDLEYIPTTTHVNGNGNGNGSH